MKYYFCLVPKEDDAPINMGYRYAKEHESSWIEGDSTIYEFLTCGYVKGMDFVVKDDKVYMIWKSFIMPGTNSLVILAKESTQACDVIDFANYNKIIEDHKQYAEVDRANRPIRPQTDEESNSDDTEG